MTFIINALQNLQYPLLITKCHRIKLYDFPPLFPPCMQNHRLIYRNILYYEYLYIILSKLFLSQLSRMLLPNEEIFLLLFRRTVPLQSSVKFMQVTDDICSLLFHLLYVILHFILLLQNLSLNGVSLLTDMETIRYKLQWVFNCQGTRGMVYTMFRSACHHINERYKRFVTWESMNDF